MPKISPSKVPGNGAIDTNAKLTFRQRLMDRFAAHDWVRVINIDDEPYVWQYLPSHAEEFEFTPDPMKITRRGEVEAYQLDPGESEVILGENAFVMIEGLYKRVSGKNAVKRTPSVAPGFARAYNWDDGIQQEEFIKLIYLGKENPTFDSGTAPDMSTTVVKELEAEKDNGRKNPEVAPSRMRQTSQRA